VFGALLALQAHRIWELLGHPAPFHVVEPGAGSGQLARDFLDYSVLIGERFYNSLVYLAIDRYAKKNSAHPNLQPIISDNIPLKGITGCLISNELLDAFPFHRFRIHDGQVKEIFVTLNEREVFVETLDLPSTSEIPDRLRKLGIALPDGHTGEVNLDIQPWVSQVSDSMERGFVITIDYGHEARELYSLNRPYGTFDTYYRHTRGASPYQRPGRQDITSHVDFSLLMSEGEKAGLNNIALMTQGEYLHRLGFGKMRDLLRARSLNQHELQANMMGMLELVKPDGFGNFKVLVQEKGTGIADIGEVTKETSPPDVPLLKLDHTPLSEGRYPHLSWEMDSLWPFAGNEPEEA
jgi:SAM-dependent MidA family methyltransferase